MNLSTTIRFLGISEYLRILMYIKKIVEWKYNQDSSKTWADISSCDISLQ